MTSRPDRARLCLCLTESTLAADAVLLDRFGDAVDMAELRADCLDPSELPAIGAFAAGRPGKLILTIRRATDGGRWTASEEDRLGVLRAALGPGRFAFVDLEEDYDPEGLLVAVRSAGTGVIRSRHDRTGVPPRLADVVRTLGRRAGEIPKLAVTPRSTVDLLSILTAMRDLRDSEVGRWILLGMGEHGVATRILATPLGAWLTYTSVVTGGAAPGQVPVEDMLGLYRFRSLGASTLRYAVIGNPVGHSRSPAIHNPALAALGLDAVYLPLLVDDIEAFLRVAQLLDLRGVSVTVPHKLAVLPYLARREAAVVGVGACNTLVREDGGAWFGANTDVEGFLAPLAAARRAPGPATRATVIGAGGAARAVVWALRSRGAQVLVLNRSPERAAALAAEMGCAAGPLGPVGAAQAREYRDLVVQTTTRGMEPDTEGDPLPEYVFQGTELVYDLVYRPAVTRILARARAAGCRTIGGMEMLLGQAYRQFELFTGRPYPRDTP